MHGIIDTRNMGDKIRKLSNSNSKRNMRIIDNNDIDYGEVVTTIHSSWVFGYAYCLTPTGPRYIKREKLRHVIIQHQ